MVETLYNTSGIIEAPADPSGAFYQPNARYLWIMDMQKSNVNIEVTVEEMDLGVPYTNIHNINEDNTKVNFTAGDFILVGAGELSVFCSFINIFFIIIFLNYYYSIWLFFLRFFSLT